MRLLLISDLHGHGKCLIYLEQILAKEKVDGLVCSGDITMYGDLDYLKRLFFLIETNKIEGFVIWGNSDTEAVQNAILKSDYNSHLKAREIEGLKVYGISYSNSDEIPEVDSKAIKDSILVTHRPPLVSTMRVKYNNAPKYHISGHIHTAARKIKYPSTTLIQVPSLQMGRYAIFEPNKDKVEFFTA